MPKKIGLIINPVAGIGGRVGLKGSDGAEIQQKAVELGAVSRSAQRALEALNVLAEHRLPIGIVTYPGEMIVIATMSKLLSLPGNTLFVDTGDQALDRELSGYMRVVTGYKEESVCRVII